MSSIFWPIDDLGEPRGDQHSHTASPKFLRTKIKKDPEINSLQSPDASVTMNVAYKWTPAQMDIFELFFMEDLGFGAKVFWMPVRLDPWQNLNQRSRIVGPYRASHAQTYWNVAFTIVIERYYNVRQIPQTTLAAPFNGQPVS